ncbi:hypothetical protein PSI9734_01494 [Pseudidiomarina piscicola]|uniref:Peptidase S54 rhomboid domain-containing protein n=1 Tax=Pseudidiomarina piscicola TaxID=2614830 RepID=A0A6S6WPC6_9GAMM|nr:rhombosortase [Pseudidiomarina piscicola]CAB0151079.1 hypothetical protein PSI9734_01494 [Pseudidiomarina piscicola]VZT40587.1 hypothetical protein PSI9734_01494 [Pseudomonas aeruginosa]
MEKLGLKIPTSGDALLPTLSLIGVLVAFMCLPHSWQDALKLNSHAVREGQHIWQLFSAQLIHHNWLHLTMNVLGIVVCWMLFIDHQQGWRRWAWLPVIMLTSSLAQIYFDPEVRFYAGFSGTLYGIFAYCALSDVLNRRWLGGLILIGLLGKVGYDLLYLPELSGLAFAAHTGGVVAGLVLAFLCKILTLNHS